MEDFIELKEVGVTKALLTPTEVERYFGKRYFYRMRLFRWEREGYLRAFRKGKKKYYYSGDVVVAAEQSLRNKLKGFLGKHYNFVIRFRIQDKEITVHGLHPKSKKHWEVDIDTNCKNESSLVLKVIQQMNWPGPYWT